MSAPTQPSSRTPAAGGIFLKMVNAADMLAVHYLAQTGQMSGEFVQEIEPPWDVWWSASVAAVQAAMRAAASGGGTATTAVWTVGEPAGSTRAAAWVDLFKKFVIHTQDDQQIADLVVIRTADRATFFEIVRRHFLLQQGLVDFAVLPDATWLIRIRHPSLWALSLLANDRPFTVFNQVPDSEGLFVKAGYTIAVPENGIRLNSFHLAEGSLLLLDHAGQIEALTPTWTRGDAVIEVRVEAPHLAITDEREKIVITPALRATEELHLQELWMIDDVVKFKEILANESMKRFAGFAAWFCQDRRMWLYAFSSQADRGLASVFGDAFRGFTRLDKTVFVPAGRVLAPRLAEERLKQIYTCGRDDFLVLDNDGEALVAHVLPNSGLKKIDFFVTFAAENAVRQIANYESTWTFDFPTAKKKE